MSLEVRTITVEATPTLLAAGGRSVIVAHQSHEIWLGGADVNDSDRGMPFTTAQGNKDASEGGTLLPYGADLYAVKASGNGATVTVKVMTVAPLVPNSVHF